MSGLIPRPFIDELLHRTDLVELIDGYIPLKKRGNSYTTCCPFHNEKTPSFNVVSQKQFYHCFGCGASGNAISFIMAYLKQSFTDAIETLAARIGLQVPHTKQQQFNQNLNLYQLLEQVNKFYQHNLNSSGSTAINYLQQRGLNNAVIQRFQLGYAPPEWHTLSNKFNLNKADLIKTGMLKKKSNGQTYDSYRNRLMFPIHDRHGKIIGFGGRALDDDQIPKYLNSPETVIFKKDRELYGLHQILIADSPIDKIIIVEGYLDVIALAQHDIVNTVATLGTATSSFHIQILLKYTNQLIFCFDGDKAGRQAAWRALQRTLPNVESGLDARFMFLPEGQDPDSMVRAEGKTKFLARLADAMPLSQYFIETLIKDIDVQTVAGKNQLLNAAKPYLLSMPESAYKELLIGELARYTHLENHRIAQFTHDYTPVIIEEKNKTNRTPIKLAIALLLQYPEIYHTCQNQIEIDNLTSDELLILKKLLQQIAKKPSINTAALIELWRDTPIFNSLVKLAGSDLPITEEKAANEFIEIINFLRKQNLENKINQYIAKSRKEGLTDAERLVLKDMLMQRHQPQYEK